MQIGENATNALLSLPEKDELVMIKGASVTMVCSR